MVEPTCKRLAAVLLTLAALPAALAAEDSRVEFARDDAKGQMRILVDGKEALVYGVFPTSVRASFCGVWYRWLSTQNPVEDG